MKLCKVPKCSLQKDHAEKTAQVSYLTYVPMNQGLVPSTVELIKSSLLLVLTFKGKQVFPLKKEKENYIEKLNIY